MKKYIGSTSLPSCLTSPNPFLYTSQNYVVLDFETTALDKGDPANPDNELLLACWKVGATGNVKAKWGSQYKQKQLLNDIENADFIVAHNAKFELGWLERCGYDITSKPLFCTMLADYVIYGNLKVPLDLSSCTKRRGLPSKESVVDRMIKGGADPREIPRDWLVKYCVQDVTITGQLMQLQLQEMLSKELLPVFYQRNLVTIPIYDIQRRGICLDPERVKKAHRDAVAEVELLEEKLQDLVGDVNIKSSKQMAELLYTTLGFDVPLDHRKQPMVTKGGAPATDVNALAALRPKTKKQADFLAIKKKLASAKDVLSKYLNSMKACCDEAGGILYAELRQTNTKTHRLASGGKKYKVQLQNIMRSLKQLIKARTPGWEISEADEAQLEYRIAVDLAQDPAGLSDILNKVDAHGFTASIIFQKRWNDPNLTPEERSKIRTAAKAHTFKPLYGGTSGTPAQKAYYQAFALKHIEITRMQNGWIDEVLRTKQLRLASGLIAYWPNARRSHTGYATNTTETSNLPVQSLATAEVVPIGLACAWYRMRSINMQSFLTNTVHDSIVGEIHPDEKEVFNEIAVQALETDVVEVIEKLYNYKIRTPLEAEVKFGTHWGG